MRTRAGSWKGDRARRGSALILSLVAVVGVLALATTFTQIASAVSGRQAQAAHRKQAFYMAEAGLAESYAALMCGRSGRVGSPDRPARLGNGLFWVEATEDEADPAVVHLDSHGMVGSGRATLSVVARRGTKPVAALGVYSGGALEVPAGSTIDAYDSSVADYDSTDDRSGAQVGAATSILVEGTEFAPTIIDGDVTPGPDQELTVGPAVTVTGSGEPAFQETRLPDVELPDIALASAVVHDSPYPLVIPSGRAGYSALAVASGAQATIQGPAQVVLGDLALASEAELVFDTTGGAIELYLTGSVSLPAGSQITTTGTDPAQVLIQISSESVEGDPALEIAATAAFHGVLYAPKAALEVGPGFEVFGALVAGQLEFSGPANLHFDSHLAAVAAEGVAPSMVSWWIVELASAPDVASNPFEVLGVDPATLAVGAAAREDQVLAIDYYDSSSVYHTYTGPESGFDWSLVGTVIAATRDGIPVLFPRATKPPLGVPKSPGTLPIVDLPL